MSYLLVAELPLFALKFKNFSWADNKYSFSLLIISVILLVWIKIAALPVIIILYLLLSAVKNGLRAKV
jgi:CDP-diacylglycerol--serine O-phosphatidyltransferase